MFKFTVRNVFYGLGGDLAKHTFFRVKNQGATSSPAFLENISYFHILITSTVSKAHFAYQVFLFKYQLYRGLSFTTTELTIDSAESRVAHKSRDSAFIFQHHNYTAIHTSISPHHAFLSTDFLPSAIPLTLDSANEISIE